MEELEDDGIDFDEDEDLVEDEKMEEIDAGPSDDLLEFVESYNRSHETRSRPDREDLS